MPAGSQQATGLPEDGFWLCCLLACSCQVDTENVHSPRRPTPPAGSAEGNHSGGGLFPWLGDLRCHQVMGRRPKTPQKVTTKGGVWWGGQEEHIQSGNGIITSNDISQKVTALET